MRILNKEILVKGETAVTKIDVYAPLIASKAKPGQFIVLMVKPEGERIPLTVVEADKASGAWIQHKAFRNNECRRFFACYRGSSGTCD